MKINVDFSQFINAKNEYCSLNVNNISEGIIEEFNSKFSLINYSEGGEIQSRFQSRVLAETYCTMARSTQFTYYNAFYYYKEDDVHMFIFRHMESFYLYIFFKIENEKRGKEIIEKSVLKFEKKKEKKAPRINLLCNGQNGFFISEVDLKNRECLLELNYGEEFKMEYEKINELVRKNEAGLFLFHGLPGSGKTSLVKKIIADNLELKILYIPANIANSLADPNFIPFLISNKINVLIIEDAEIILKSREETGNLNGVSNLLNITDGFLADVFNLRVICTFNTARNKIDEALLRKGRLKYIKEFGPLSIKDSNTLLKHLKKPPQNKEMTLADIYNFDVCNNVRGKVKSRTKAI